MSESNSPSVQIPWKWIACGYGEHEKCYGQVHQHYPVKADLVCPCRCHTDPEPAVQVEDHVVSGPSTTEEIFAGDNKVIQEALKKNHPSAPPVPVLSITYLNPCESCGKPIQKTGKRGRPPRVHPGGCPGGA